MRMQTTQARSLIGGRFPVGLSCAQEHACAGFQDSKTRDAFDHRSLVRSTDRYHQGGDFLLVRVEFYISWSWFSMHHGF